MDGTDLLNWRDFERDLKYLNRSPRTIQSYQEAARQLSDFTAGRWCTNGCDHEHHDAAPFDEMTKEHVQDYILEVQARHSVQTASVRHRSLRRFFNWLVSEDVIPESPMKRLGEPEPEEKPTEIPPIDHVRNLLATCEPKTRAKDPRRHFNNLRDAAIIRLFCEAGAPRVAEMASLEVARVDMTLDTISILGKGNRWRSVPFSNKTGKALSRYLRERPKHPLVVQARHRSKDPRDDGPARLWLGWRGKPLNASGIYQMIERRCEEADIPRIHPHALRHFAADQWYAAGGSVQDAMALFGWKSPEMANHYAKQHAGKRAIADSQRRALGDKL